MVGGTRRIFKGETMKKKFNLIDRVIFRISIFIMALLILTLIGMAIDVQKEEPVAKKKEANYQTWKLPIYMQENLQWMLNDFNKRFDEKVQGYKKELKTRFTEFKDMPDDAVLYLEGGIFIERSDYLRLQRYMRDIENLANRPKEVKEDGK